MGSHHRWNQRLAGVRTFTRSKTVLDAGPIEGRTENHERNSASASAQRDSPDRRHHSVAIPSRRRVWAAVELFSLLTVLGEVAELITGTLDLLVLKAVSLAPVHGYGILLRIGQISGGALTVEQGALYPAL